MRAAPRTALGPPPLRRSQKPAPVHLDRGRLLLWVDPGLRGWTHPPHSHPTGPEAGTATIQPLVLGRGGNFARRGFYLDSQGSLSPERSLDFPSRAHGER